MKEFWIIFAIVILSLGLLFIAFHFLMIEYIFRKFFSRTSLEFLENLPLKDSYYDKVREEIFAAKRRMKELPFKEVEITSSDGLKLVADYYDFGKEKTAICMHGYHSLPLNGFSVVAERFIKQGYNVLLPFQRAHGKSEGKYMTYGLKESDDLLKWIDFISAIPSCEKILVYGISMGGATVGIASSEITSKKVKALVIDCGYTTVDALLWHIVEERNLPGKLFIPGISRLVKRRIGMGFTDADTEKSLCKNKIPTLFIYGDCDKTVSKECIEKNYSACKAEKDLLIVEGAGHSVALISGGEDALCRFDDFVNKHV